MALSFDGTHSNIVWNSIWNFSHRDCCRQNSENMDRKSVPWSASYLQSLIYKWNKKQDIHKRMGHTDETKRASVNCTLIISFTSPIGYKNLDWNVKTSRSLFRKNISNFNSCDQIQPLSSHFVWGRCIDPHKTNFVAVLRKKHSQVRSSFWRKLIGGRSG